MYDSGGRPHLLTPCKPCCFRLFQSYTCPLVLGHILDLHVEALDTITHQLELLLEEGKRVETKAGSSDAVEHCLAINLCHQSCHKG